MREKSKLGWMEMILLAVVMFSEVLWSEVDEEVEVQILPPEAFKITFVLGTEDERTLVLIGALLVESVTIAIKWH